tara:strand:+ start:546 stop:734 length:189 start_codon:yes stop_codon:yes gene_type:complete
MQVVEVVVKDVLILVPLVQVELVVVEQDQKPVLLLEQQELQILEVGQVVEVYKVLVQQVDQV